MIGMVQLQFINHNILHSVLLAILKLDKNKKSEVQIMKLEPRKIRLENIMLDPENPRSIGEIEDSQNKIQEYIRKSVV